MATVHEFVDSTRLLKDSFLKVNYHLMPNLPGSDLKCDLEMFKEIFKNPAYRPDMLKIYPCLLVKTEYGRTELHDLYEKGEWKPYTEEETAKLIARAKRSFPKWVRVMRIQRDIPSQHILAGVKHSNLRQLVEDELKKQGMKCRCIRCREIRNHKIVQEKLLREDYEASGGKEIFLSYEDPSQDALLGFLRLRVPGEPFRNEITPQNVGVRELHVYGPMVPIGERSRDKTQHKGYGERLLEEAERIAREELDARNILVISGVGAREYYRRLGYKLKGAYMSKPLS